MESSLLKYDNIYNQIVDYINTDNKEALIKLLESYHINSDRGEVRTILITLKPIIHQHQYLSNLYSSLKDILRFGSTSGII